MSDMLDEKTRASAWFRELRNEIVTAFEGLEDAFGGDEPAGRFEVSETTRQSDDGSDAGGGLMSVMRGGRVFEGWCKYFNSLWHARQPCSGGDGRAQGSCGYGGRSAFLGRGDQSCGAYAEPA